MKKQKRAHLFSLFSLLFILVCLSVSLHAQESDTIPKSFSRLKLELETVTPYVAPLPVTTPSQGIPLMGQTPPLMTVHRMKLKQYEEWDKNTRLLFYSRTISSTDFELPRYAETETNARYYGATAVNDYWKENLRRATQKSEKDKAGGLVDIKVDIPDAGILKSIAGESSAGLNVSGYQKITFSGRSQWTDKEDDALNRVSKFPSLDMKQVSRYSIKGSIGTKITVEVDQNSERKTDLANTIKIRYKGEEDEILQTVEAGNTNLSLPNTQFVGYSQRVQGLFGIKATAKVGPLDLTAIVSQEKGSTESAAFTAGASQSTNTKRDYDYLQRTFFWLFTPSDPYYGRITKIVESEIYVFHQVGSNAADDVNTQWQYAQVAVDPEHYGSFPSEDQVTSVKRLEYDEYYVYNNAQYLEVFTYDRTKLLAGWFRAETVDGDTITIGDKTLNAEDQMTLKLIALRENEADSTYATFYNEWRNIYSLGAQDIDPDGIEVQVYLGAPGTETKEDENLFYIEETGTYYIQILGLDRYDVTGAAQPDGVIDAKDNNILIRDRGYLVFPNSRPFDPDRSYAISGETLPETVPEIYDLRKSTITGNPTSYTKYYIQFKTEQRQTEYYLGHINIIENSERVMLNGEELKKDRDYKIYYELGRINFLTDAVSDPNADLQIDFEYEPFIASEKKNLFGLRGEYEVSSKLKVGSTVLYKGEKSTDRKPRIGQETSKSLVWDADFSYDTDLPFLTSLTDALPLVEATAPSQFSISGEIAQSRPNPNTAGQAYVDDFESAKETFSLGVTRYQWTKSSYPSLIAGNRPTRGSLIWYNPYDPYVVTDIYNRDSRGNDRKTTLSLQFKPATHKKVENIEDPCNPTLEEIEPTDSWAGVMRAFSSGSQDQTSSQLLEIRMKVNNGNTPLQGKFYIDLGDINEDIDGDGWLDTEDENSNGILESFEDIGLDSAASPDEPCYDETTNPDPSGDDFNYDSKYDYSHINGTEGNRYDAGGSRPDTEDLDGKGALNTQNKYFEFLIDFSDNQFLVPESEINGWETYRISLADTSKYELINNPDWGKISYARMWLTDFDSSVLIEIADINLVSTRWEEDSILPRDIDRTMLEEQPLFNVSVVNTEENLDYTFPPGVEPYYDKSTDTYEKEQSLLLHFENLQVHKVLTEVLDDNDMPTGEVDTTLTADTVFASRELYQAEDYAGYQKIQMYVHGPEDLPDGPSDIEFIFRMGKDADNFYQFQTKLYPGWHDSNEVVIDFNEITPLKDSLTKLRSDDNTITQLSSEHYTVKGSPSLTSNIYFSVGVTNADTLNQEPISGDIWIDELRLTDVRDDAGLAMRLSVSGAFSDFISYSLSYKKQDAFFRNLTSSNTSSLGSGKETVNYTYNTKVNVHKLLPPSWGASIPVSYSWSESVSTPRLKPGSDIIIPENQRDNEASRSVNRRLSISESFRKKGGNLLFGLILNRLKSSFSYSETASRSPTVPSSASESYQAQATYDLTPTGTYTVPILFWLKPIPLIPESISNSQFGYLPNKLNFSGTVKKNYSTSINTQNYRTTTYSRTFSGNMNLGWSIFRNLTSNYTMATERDIGDPENLNFSFNPSKAKLGIELENRQTFQMDYSPSLFRFLTHKFTYKANYNENADPARNQLGTRNVNNGNTFSISGSFSPKGFFGTGSGKKGSPADSTKGGISIHKPFLSFIRFFTNRLDEIRGSYSLDNKFTYWGLEDRPTWKYILGLDTDPGVSVNDSITQGTTRNVNTKSRTYSAQSGIRFILGSKIALRYSFSEKESSVRNNKSEDETFPDMGFTLSNLERYRLVKFFFNTLSFDTKYSRKIGKTISLATGEEVLNDRSTTTSYSPLAKLNFTWFNKLVCTMQYDKQIALKEQFQDSQLSNGVRSTTNSWQFTARMTLSPSEGINFPIFGRLKSSLSFNLSISKKNTKSENNQYNGNGWSITSEKTDFTVMPRITYNFSTNINGGLTARWQDSNDKTRFQKTHVRELGIWVEITF